MIRTRSPLPSVALAALLVLPFAPACNDRPASADSASTAAAGSAEGIDTVGGSVVTAAGASTAAVPDGTPASPDAALPSPATRGTSTATAATSTQQDGDTTPAASGATASPATTTTSSAGAVLPGTPMAGIAPAVSTSVPPATGAATPATNARADVPWDAGEKFTYDVRFGAVDVGDATMEVRGIVDVRGRDTYHTVFRVRGGTLFFKVDDRYESWIDVRTLSSLRHKQDIDEANYERERTFEIFPDRRVYRENDKPEQPTVAQPLDDGSFFYFIRTVPLEAGQTYTFNNYFRPDRNPVTIKVLRRERVQVPAGTFPAVVIQPLIKTKGVFGEGGRAEIWLSDDSTRTMLQMKSQLKFGSLNLYLKDIRRPPAAP